MTNSDSLLRYGLTLSLCDPISVEMAAMAGYGFVRIDWEHMLLDDCVIKQMIRIGHLLDIPVHIRVSGNANLTALIDLGITGIMIPRVSNRDIAERAVELVKYSPLGNRGMNSTARVLNFGITKFSDYFIEANDKVKLIVQIEDEGGVENLEAILTLPGVDMVATGRMDLSQALGVPGDTNNAQVIGMEEYIIRKTISYGKVPIIKAGNKERVLQLQDLGVRWFHIGRDESLLNNAIRQRIETVAI